MDEWELRRQLADLEIRFAASSQQLKAALLRVADLDTMVADLSTNPGVVAAVEAERQQALAAAAGIMLPPSYTAEPSKDKS